MADTERQIDPLSDELKSHQEAPEFWDTHSITDYEEFLKPVDLDVDIQRHHFEIEVDEESFLALWEPARKEQKPVRQLAGEILRQRLRAGRRERSANIVSFPTLKLVWRPRNSSPEARLERSLDKMIAGARFGALSCD